MPDFVTVAIIVIAAVILLTIATISTILSLRGIITIAYNGEFSVHYRVLFLKIPIFPLPKKKEKKRNN